MGLRGPAGKRSDQKHGHRSKEELKADRAPGAELVEVPEVDSAWHPIAVRWFEALAESGQSAFYEPSDWAEALYIAEMMSRSLLTGRVSAQLFAAVLSGSTRLLTTEADRRRLKLELERTNTADADEEAAVTALDDYRARFSG